MQTVEFLHTAKWIRNLYSEKAQFLFSLLDADPHINIGLMVASGEAVLPINARLTHHLAVVRERLIANPLAVEILKAFHLEMLIDEMFPIELAELNQESRPKNRGREPGVIDRDDDELRELRSTQRRGAYDLLEPVWRGWRLLTKCIEPIETLVVPNEVLNEQNFDEVLTLELRYEEEISPSVETVSSMLIDAQALYANMATLYGLKEYPPLTVIYADSGTSIRLDLRGLGEPIKRLKELFLESWAFIRHRKAEDFRQNNLALLEGLESLQKIKAMREQGTLDPEDALRYSRLIVESTTRLFEAGVLIREIPKSEVVSNQTLIEGYYRRLLPPKPGEQTLDDQHVPISTKPRRRRTTSRKSKSKRSLTAETKDDGNR